MASKIEDTYDYIVCGGGTSGCVVAGRLAENPEVKILLIEAGQHNKDLENVHMTGGWSNNFDAETDWNLVTPPMAGVDNRQVKLSRGRFLGGSSGCNGTLCIRGNKQDYDDWGLEGWSGEEFFKAMRKSETFHSKPWFKADKESHGYSGPLHTEPHDLAPISQLLLDSYVSQGMPLHDDMFSSGDVAQGCGHVPRTVYQGLRTTGADFVTNKNHRGNITIKTDTTVDKIIFSKQANATRASGVATLTSDGTSRIYHARKEIIISGGAYCSPSILLRSGIGPKAELAQHNIPCTVNLPGVGKNLMDHLIVFMFYETEKEGLTNDHHVYHDSNFDKTYEEWKTQKSGFLSTFPFGSFAFARLDERLKDEPLWKNASRQPGRDPMGLTPSQPNIEFFSTECYGGPKQYDQFPINYQHAFSMIAELFAPKSRGSVTLKSADALENPIVDCNYLADPLDLLILSEACRFGNEVVMKGAGTKDIVKGSWPPNLNHHSYTTREEWVPYVKEHATTCYHAAGTCAMGRKDNPMAVLDEKLQVRGVSGLRVADCSVMPTLHGGHTQMPAYGIGEKCADLIKETWRMAGNTYPRI
ncbi:Glucose-methanol-choline oxidoreductase [Penicillium canescens]|uniref:Glucose-methanol-choline oxidoreductase n=1 Tax=Penicillium canescens TaxID=5083 RepID=A0AAD6NEG6_PENCN|nr:Glucose-methanol-choline oxidoreductase [Penicillium canescens]KAJ6033305.1 Glucose-methanol-choline oxidoreductase [Penicillium canescens]KAJ6057506.1 Glucose-methanol-choline oxidoreductase [Penicillium canescens]KAJ6058822.1 Glucose-methanol-choline oxidoreductase [Penicillium canescens]